VSPPARGEDELPYVLAAVVVPIVLMCAMLIMERLEQRVLGSPVHADDDRSSASSPPVWQPPITEHKIVAESPRAA
jgi:hypothetical protein